MLGEVEEVELDAEPAVVATSGLLALGDEGVELLALEERGSVDALQLFVALVAAPVDAGHPQQLDRAKPAGVGDVRAAAEVDEIAGAIDPDLLYLVAHAVDDVDLEGLVKITEEPACIVPRHHLAFEGDPPLGQLLHPGLDPGEILLHEARAIREAEVVEEALLRGRADVVLCARVQLEHRGRHQVRRAVAEDVEGQLSRGGERRTCLGGVVDDVVGHGGEL